MGVDSFSLITPQYYHQPYLITPRQTSPKENSMYAKNRSHLGDKHMQTQELKEVKGKLALFAWFLVDMLIGWDDFANTCEQINTC